MRHRLRDSAKSRKHRGKLSLAASGPFCCLQCLCDQRHLSRQTGVLEASVRVRDKVDVGDVCGEQEIREPQPRDFSKKATGILDNLSYLPGFARPSISFRTSSGGPEGAPYHRNY